jgi:hypothetical protein
MQYVSHPLTEFSKGYDILNLVHNTIHHLHRFCKIQCADKVNIVLLMSFARRKAYRGDKEQVVLIPFLGPVTQSVISVKPKHV